MGRYTPPIDSSSTNSTSPPPSALPAAPLKGHDFSRFARATDNKPTPRRCKQINAARHKTEGVHTPVEKPRYVTRSDEGWFTPLSRAREDGKLARIHEFQTGRRRERRSFSPVRFHVWMENIVSANADRRPCVTGSRYGAGEARRKEIVLETGDENSARHRALATRPITIHQPASGRALTLQRVAQVCMLRVMYFNAGRRRRLVSSRVLLAHARRSRGQIKYARAVSLLRHSRSQRGIMRARAQAVRTAALPFCFRCSLNRAREAAAAASPTVASRERVATRMKIGYEDRDIPCIRCARARARASGRWSDAIRHKRR